MYIILKAFEFLFVSLIMATIPYSSNDCTSSFIEASLKSSSNISADCIVISCNFIHFFTPRIKSCIQTIFEPSFIVLNTECEDFSWEKCCHVPTLGWTENFSSFGFCYQDDSCHYRLLQCFFCSRVSLLPLLNSKIRIAVSPQYLNPSTQIFHHI